MWDDSVADLAQHTPRNRSPDGKNQRLQPYRPLLALVLSKPCATPALGPPRTTAADRSCRSRVARRYRSGCRTCCTVRQTRAPFRKRVARQNGALTNPPLRGNRRGVITSTRSRKRHGSRLICPPLSSSAKARRTILLRSGYSPPTTHRLLMTGYPASSAKNQASENETRGT